MTIDIAAHRTLLDEWDAESTPELGRVVHNAGGFALTNAQLIRANYRALLNEVERLTSAPTDAARAELILDLREAAPRNRSVLMERAADALSRPTPPITDDLVEAVTRKRYGHLWSPLFEATLAKLPLFTPEQAAESTEMKRQEKRDLVRAILEAAEVAP